MSGGTTTVINSTLCGLIQGIRRFYPKSKIYAGVPGIDGVLKEKVFDLSNITDHQLYRLQRTPASGFIGTSRVKPVDSDDIHILQQVMADYDVKYFVNIGGNGTIQQSRAIAEQINDVKTIALPKTVDNDLGDEDLMEVYFTPGYISAVNYWKHITELMNIENLGACSHDKVLIAQTFGRETGFLAAAARLADPHRKYPLLILLPEDQRSEMELLNRIDSMISNNNRCMIVMCEGYKVGDIDPRRDKSGQVMFGSSRNLYSQNLVNLCNDNNIQARALMPTVDQRSNILYTTVKDMTLAAEVGFKSIETLNKSLDKFFYTVSRDKDTNVYFQAIDFNSTSKYNRILSDKFIDKGNYDISDNYLHYLKDLVGNNEIIDKIDFLYLDELS